MSWLLAIIVSISAASKFSPIFEPVKDAASAFATRVSTTVSNVKNAFPIALFAIALPVFETNVETLFLNVLTAVFAESIALSCG